MHDYQGFLHDHPKKQNEFNLNPGHVIVDKGDWNTIRKALYADDLLPYKGFLHDHPFSAYIDEQHVVVDKEDWEIIRRHYAESPEEIYRGITLTELLEILFNRYPNNAEDENIDHPVTKSYRSSKKIKKNDIIDFKIYWLISILHYVISYTLWMLLGIRFKSLSISKDPIKYFAGVVFNKSEKSITVIERETAKLILFKSIFGKN